MSLNELVTYIEELTFRTTMFGYDRDEVDVQLDKINDEIMALVKEKDAQIAALKKGEVIVEEASEKQPESSKEEDTEDEITLYPGGIFETAVEDERESDVDSGLDEEAFSKAGSDETFDLEDAEKRALAAEEKVRELTARIEELTEQLRQTESRAEYAEAEADEAAEKAHTFAARVEELEAIISAGDHEESGGEPAVLLVDEETEEFVEPERVSPGSADEAYNQYMRNADLLCRQLSLIDDQKEEVLKEARTEADSIVTEARSKAETILGDASQEAGTIVEEANEQAEGILRDVEEEKERLLEEINAQREEKLANLEADKAFYEELLDKKAQMLMTLRRLSEEAGQLADNYDV